MRADEVDYGFWQFVLVGECNAESDVRYDDLCRFFVAYLAMRVEIGVLIFYEEYGGVYFTYVMVKSSCPDKQCVAAYFMDKVFGNVGNLHAVLECARCLYGQFSQYFGIGICIFYQGEVAEKSEHLFQNQYERNGEKNHYCIECEHQKPVYFQLIQFNVLYKCGSYVYKRVADEYQQTCKQKIGAFVRVFYAYDCHHSRYELIEHEFKTVGYGKTYDDY